MGESVAYSRVGLLLPQSALYVYTPDSLFEVGVEGLISVIVFDLGREEGEFGIDLFCSVSYFIFLTGGTRSAGQRWNDWAGGTKGDSYPLLPAPLTMGGS